MPGDGPPIPRGWCHRCRTRKQGSRGTHHLRRSAITACIIFVALANVQCGGDRREVQVDSGTLTIHVADQDERVLGPLGANPWFLVFLGLAVDPERTGDPQPRLLDRWEHTPDYTEWTVHVRDDVQWDDGVPVTAEDVKFSLELWTDPEILYEYRWFEKITVLDSHTLRITFKEPVSSTIFMFNWLAILPKHRLDTLDIEEGGIFNWPFWVQPIGDGPFRYVRHVPKTMTELEANPDYYGETPKIPRVVLRYGGNAFIELLSGNVDIASGITPLQAVQLAADPRFRTYHSSRANPRDVAITWNHRNPLFRDADVRRALTMSIDRRTLHRILNYPDDLPMFDVPALARHHARGMVPDPLPFDPERAARLFARAGWVDTDDDNILEKNGQEFRFTMSTTANESAEAVFIQDQLRRAGIRMEISSYDLGALRQEIRGRDFDAVIQTYNYIEQFGEFSASGYENPEVSRLRDAAWSTFDQNDHDRHLLELWQIFGEDIPITYLHPSIAFLAAHRRVKGLQNNRDLFRMVEHLWIEDGGDGPKE